MVANGFCGINSYQPTAFYRRTIRHKREKFTVMTVQLRIIVSGLVGLYPVGGNAWFYLQYVLGLARLGHDVYYHEDTWSWPYHPVEKTYTSNGSYSARYIGDFFERYAPELRGRWHYLHLHETSFGMTRTAFNEVARTADLFLNVSGAGFIPDNLSPRCIKIFLDTDPGYNQIMLIERFEWSENVEQWCASVRAHEQHFTFAENIHGADCTVPKLDFDWKTTRPPIVIDVWAPVAQTRPPEGAPWTTVTNWNTFKGKLFYKGKEYKSKGAEFEKLIELPRLVGVPLKVGLGGINAPFQRLASNGWQVFDGPEATLTPSQYMTFIAGSRGEISPAKHVYVATRSGWFSDRSARHLASGRPVVVQDTGFSEVLPVGEGLLAFTTPEEAGDAIQEIERDYDRHAKAAREIAEEYFDATAILASLVDASFQGET